MDKIEPPQNQAAETLADLGWSDFFASQIEPNEVELAVARIDTVHRTRITGISTSGPLKLQLPLHVSTAGFAVGDWVLADPPTGLVARRLERKTLLERRTQTGMGPQLAGANVDTLFIVTSCNADFSPARLERYLAMANEAGVEPVIVLTKADTVDDAAAYAEQAKILQRGLAVITLNARSPEAAKTLAPWCGKGRTVALIGSSGVGKSTLVNTLAGLAHGERQQTGEIRERDAKGRHTTTARSLHAIAGGGWIIDTPGMRTLQVSDVAGGIDMLFSEISELAPLCRFRDCTHAHEPGCAVLAAVASGDLDPERLARWRKLTDENAGNAARTSPTGRPVRPGQGKKR